MNAARQGDFAIYDFLTQKFYTFKSKAELTVILGSLMAADKAPSEGAVGSIFSRTLKDIRTTGKGQMYNRFWMFEGTTDMEVPSDAEFIAFQARGNAGWYLINTETGEIIRGKQPISDKLASFGMVPNKAPLCLWSDIRYIGIGGWAVCYNSDGRPFEGFDEETNKLIVAWLEPLKFHTIVDVATFEFKVKKGFIVIPEQLMKEKVA